MASFLFLFLSILDLSLPNLIDFLMLLESIRLVLSAAVNPLRSIDLSELSNLFILNIIICLNLLILELLQSLAFNVSDILVDVFICEIEIIGLVQELIKKIVLWI